MATTTWLDTLLGKVVAYLGVSVPTRPVINFQGDGVSVADNPGTKSTDVTISAAGVQTFTIDSGSPAISKGDPAAPMPTDPTKLTRGTPAAVLAAGGIAGIFKEAHLANDTNVTVYPPGSTIPASVFSDLGGGTGSKLTLPGTGRATRNPKPTGGEIVIGTIATSGEVTFTPIVPFNTTPNHEYNAITYGCVADGDRVAGTGTDNYAAIQAMIDAISAQSNASGLHPARVHFPPGVYKVSATPRLSKIAHISGDTGGQNNNGTSSWIMGAVGVTAFQCDSFGNSVDGFDSSGSTIEHMGFCGPLATHSVPFDRLTVGATLAVGSQTVPSQKARGFRNATYEVVSGGTRTLGTTVTPNGTTVNTEPTWPGEWAQNVSDPINYHYADGHFYNGDTILVANMPNTAMPYLFTASSGTATSPGNPPDSRDLPAFIASHAYADKTDIIPTAGKWTGYRYQTVGAFTSGTEPVTWGTTIGATTADGSGHLYVCEGPIWGRVIGQTTPEDTGGTILWTLTATVPTFVSGGCTFQPRFPIPALRSTAGIHVADCAIFNARGNGYELAASGQNGGAGGTNANGWTIDRLVIGQVGGHGVYTKGSDVNAGQGNCVVVSDCGGAAIHEESFLGNTWTSCQAAVTTAAPFQSLGPVNKSLWVGNYQEGGEAGSRIKYGMWYGGTGTAGFSFDSNGTILDMGGNNAITATLTKRTYLWGFDKTTNLSFQYNGPSESSAINVDPQTITLDLNDLLRPTVENGYVYKVSACDSGSSGTLGPGEPTGVVYLVVGTSSGSAGRVRIQTNVAHQFSTGDTVTGSSVGGTTEANVTTTVNRIDSTHFDMVGTTFVNAWTSGGTMTGKAWPTVIGNTVHNGTLTFQCVGRSGLTVSLGQQPNFAAVTLDVVLKWQGSDETQINTFQANCGDVGWYGFTNNTLTGNTALRLPGQNAKDLQGGAAVGMVDIYNRLCLFRGNAVGREWGGQLTGALPTSANKEVSRIIWFGGSNTLASVANGRFFIGATIVTSAGSDTWNYFGKILSDSVERFHSLRFAIGGQQRNNAGTGSVATDYTKIDTDADVILTTDATVTTLHTLDAVPTKKYVDVVVKVIAETVDTGNAPDGAAQASWLLRASYKEAGGTLTAIRTPIVIFGQPTDASNNAGGNSANWTAVIDSASNTPRVRVTGFGTDRIIWRCVVEPMR